jgi:hypothetical protein
VKIKFAILSLLSLILCATAAEEKFERYQIIIDKRPFGEEPPEDPAPKQIPLSQSFAKDLRLTMLFEGPGGDVRVGVVNNALKKNYILKIGEVEDSIELVEADIEKSEAMLKKGNEVALFKLEEGKPEPLTQKQQASRSNSYAERRKAMLTRVNEQKKKEEPAAPAEPALTGEALRKHLEEVQMNAIREGMPPLPIPLTPEMDAQLVSEGFLPPQ